MKWLCHPLISAMLVFVSYSLNGFAQSVDVPENIPKAYPKDYIFFQLSHDQPLERSREIFESDSPSYGLKYAHRLDSQWIVGLRFQRKPFIKKDDQPFSILAFSNQTQAVFRLYHPFYFLIGTEISYLVPARKSSPPFIKDPELSTEIGAGINTSLWWLVSTRGIVELHLVRWRGTKTNTIHGFEATLGYGQGF